MLPRYFPLVLLLLLLQVVHRSSALESSSNAAVEVAEDIASESGTTAERKSWSVKKTASSFNRKVKKAKDTALSSSAVLKNRMTALTSLRKPKRTPPTHQSDLSPHLSENEESEPEEIAPASPLGSLRNPKRTPPTHQNDLSPHLSQNEESEPEEIAPPYPLGRAPLTEEHPTTSASHPEAAGPATSHDEQLSQLLAFGTEDEDFAYLEAVRLSLEHSQPEGRASLPELSRAATYHPEAALPDTSHDVEIATKLQEQLNARGDEFGHHLNDHPSNELWESFPTGTHDSNELWESFPTGTHDSTYQPEPRGASPMPSWGAEQPRQPSPPQSWQTPVVADEPLRRRLDPNGNRGQSSREVQPRYGAPSPNGNRGQSSREVQPRYGAPSTSTAGVSRSAPLSMVEKDDKIHPITAIVNMLVVAWFVLFLYKRDLFPFR